MVGPGHMYVRLSEAVASAGSPRSVYAQDTTLSRRGLLTRADRRARELASLGLGPREVVAVAMGNVAEFLVLLIAASKLGAVAMPVDPSGGERILIDTTARLPVRAVVRRPRGNETEALEYPAHYEVRSRRRLSSSLLTVDVLEPRSDAPQELPAGAELVFEARSVGGAVRDVVRTGENLREIGIAARCALELDPGARILCAQPFTATRFFDAAVLGWLASEAQLVMAEGPMLADVIPIARDYEKLVVIDSLRQFIELARVLKASSSTIALTPILPQATVPLGTGRALTQAFTARPRQLLMLEELGILASRVMERGQEFTALDQVELKPGADMTIGGQEIWVRTPQRGLPLGPIPRGEPGSPAEHGFFHTGYSGKFGKRGLTEVLGRDDSLVNLEGRRACLDSIEDVMLQHRRLVWVRSELVHTIDGDPEIHVEYRATGETEVDDLQEHAIGSLPPFMVPRKFTRLSDP